MKTSINSKIRKIPYNGSNSFDAVLSDFIKTMFKVNMKSEISRYRILYVRKINSHGKKTATKFLKALYGIGVKVSLNEDIIEPIPWTISDKSGFPKCIKYMKKFLTSPNISHRRAALTVLRQYETIYCEPDPDVTSIVTPGPGPEVWNVYRTEWQHFVRSNYKTMSPEIKDEILHMTAKNGPNGPALPRSHIDALALNADKNLKEAVFRLYSSDIIPQRDPRITRGMKKEHIFNSTLKLGDKLSHRYRGEMSHSRLQFISVGGCKTRTIAICDFFSQDALKPLHKWAYRFLKRFETDGTYSHNRISQIVREKTEMRVDSFCYDLTTATDRFPIWLQTEFLKEVIGEETALSWETVISKRKFTVPGSPERLEYKCGQPMGALSSWAVFALTHHALVEFCAHLEGINPFREYVVIGDDVAIFNRKVARRYEQMLNLLEVPISKEKSVCSLAEEPNCRAEIAKRLFLNGKELSPIPTGAIHAARKDNLLFSNLVKLCQERGVEESFLAAPVHSLIETWYQAKRREEVFAIIYFPSETHAPLLKEDDMLSSPWIKFPSEAVSIVYTNVCRKRLKDKADQVYKDLLTEFNDDPIWGGLMDDLYDPNLPLHPMSLMWRSIRDKVSNTYLNVKSSRNFDPFEIEFILDPLLLDYRRKAHRRARLKGLLVLKTLKELKSIDESMTSTD